MAADAAYATYLILPDERAYGQLRHRLDVNEANAAEQSELQHWHRWQQPVHQSQQVYSSSTRSRVSLNHHLSGAAARTLSRHCVEPCRSSRAKIRSGKGIPHYSQARCSTLQRNACSQSLRLLPHLPLAVSDAQGNYQLSKVSL